MDFGDATEPQTMTALGTRRRAVRTAVSFSKHARPVNKRKGRPMARPPFEGTVRSLAGGSDRHDSVVSRRESRQPQAVVEPDIDGRRPHIPSSGNRLGVLAG